MNYETPPKACVSGTIAQRDEREHEECFSRNISVFRKYMPDEEFRDSRGAMRRIKAYRGNGSIILAVLLFAGAVAMVVASSMLTRQNREPVITDAQPSTTPPAFLPLLPEAEPVVTPALSSSAPVATATPGSMLPILSPTPKPTPKPTPTPTRTPTPTSRPTPVVSPSNPPTPTPSPTSVPPPPPPPPPGF